MIGKRRLVEVNFKDQVGTARGNLGCTEVDSVKCLETKGKPVKTVEMFFDDQIWKVEVRDGKPLKP